MQNGLQLNPDKSEAPIVGTSSQLTSTSAMSSVSVAGVDLPVADEMMHGRGSIGGKSVQLPRPGHPTHPQSTDARAGTYSGLQSDTVAAGLLQRCVVRCSSRQYSEAATRTEHCSAGRSSGAKEVTCSAAPGTAALAARPPADRLQAGRSNTQDPCHIHTFLPQRSHQTSEIYTSTPFIHHAATSQTSSIPSSHTTETLLRAISLV